MKKIVVHCSDFDRPHDIKDITEWHLARGFSTVGYHFVITAGGEIQEGRPVGTIGAHVKGHNKESIGICLCGKKFFGDHQLTILKMLIRRLLKQFPEAKITGHYELDPNKTCPNIDMNWLRGQLGV